jgi:DNA invertase Pin-like site-specific DNA recombinase
MISERTKSALAAAKARGVKLGGDRGAVLTTEAREAGLKARTARADKRAADSRPTIEALQTAGTTSLRRIAAELNNRGIQTPRGKGEWQAGTVSQLLARLLPSDARPKRLALASDGRLGRGHRQSH